MRVYLKEKYLGTLISNNSSSEYFIESPVIHNFASIDYDRIEKIGLLNDIAYYLEKKEDYVSSISILQKVIHSDSRRTVAYINLGDAYWGNGEQEKAKKAYDTYVTQMQEKGKESKIPQRVLDRVQ